MELRENGWSTKHVQRLIVSSSTYRQSARSCAANERIDPENRYLWRWTPRRLESEAIRDAALAVSGELNLSEGGPRDATETNSVRRSLYLRQHRFHLPAMQALFDAPAGNESCLRRHVSTVPLQPLHLLNNEQMLKRAEAFAARIRANFGDDRDRQINAAFEMAVGRTPDRAEAVAAMKFIQDRAYSEADKASVNSVADAAKSPLGSEAGLKSVPGSVASRSAETKASLALVHFCHALLNLNEFIYIE